MLYVSENNDLRNIEWDEISNLLSVLKDSEIVLKHRFRKKAIRYWNIPASFDIETTNAKINDEKAAWMYEWTFGIANHIFIGRRWDEYEKLVDLINHILGDARLFVGVHNLAFEFQFIRSHFQWSEVFSNDERHPIKATSGNIEYRCTATISGLDLATLADNLTSHDIKKLKGDLDYNLIRHELTNLSSEELGYCINDVRILLYYIEEQIELCGDIAKIPLTNTGRVRSYCREHCLTVTKKNGRKGRNWEYIFKMKKEQLTPHLYDECKWAFRGGFTHANPFHNGREAYGVTSYDLTSAYPSVMLTEQYPSGEPELINLDNFKPGAFDWFIEHRCCLFRATFKYLREKEDVADNYISWIPNKMEATKLGQLNNGRVTTAESLTMYMTDVDFKIIRQTYDWDELYVNDMVIWFKNYLPTAFIQCVLDFYKNKTTLKGTERKIEYQNNKGMLNSTYGMVVQDPCKDENVYDGEWDTLPVDLVDCIQRYNDSSSRFTYYPVGLWVTGYCRTLVWEAILGLGNDYVYSDTDSIKFVGDHDDWFDRKNKEIEIKVKAAMTHHRLPMDYAEPLTVKGKKVLIGLWDREDKYTTFKTLGAKRYMTCIESEYVTSTRSNYKPVRLTSRKYELTVSGVTKKAIEYLKTFEDPFQAFNTNLSIPAEWTGKLTHDYIDRPFRAVITDYQGNVCEVFEKTSVHLEPVEYSMTDDYAFNCWLDDVRRRRIKHEV